MINEHLSSSILSVWLLEFLFFGLAGSREFLEMGDIVSDLREGALDVVELFQFPVEVVAPVYVSGLASAVAVHDVLVYPVVEVFHLVEVLAYPLDFDESRHFAFVKQVVTDQLTRSYQDVYYFPTFLEGEGNDLGRVDHHSLHFFSNLQLYKILEFPPDAHHRLLGDREILKQIDS